MIACVTRVKIWFGSQIVNKIVLSNINDYHWGPAPRQ